MSRSVTSETGYFPLLITVIKTQPSFPSPASRMAFYIRLSAIAAGLCMKDDYFFKKPEGPVRWSYSGLLGILICGELLAAIGAIIFLLIDPSWPAAISLGAAVFALLTSTRRNMMLVQNLPLHTCPAVNHSGDGGRCVNVRESLPVMIDD